jgi:methionyl aminopeptidase
VSGASLHLASAKALLKTIDANFGTLVFSRRYLERLGVKNYLLGVRIGKVLCVVGYLLTAW